MLDTFKDLNDCLLVLYFSQDHGYVALRSLIDVMQLQSQ